jgi:hypothetical protein
VVAADEALSQAERLRDASGLLLVGVEEALDPDSCPLPSSRKNSPACVPPLTSINSENPA